MIQSRPGFKDAYNLITAFAFVQFASSFNLKLHIYTPALGAYTTVSALLVLTALTNIKKPLISL